MRRRRSYKELEREIQILQDTLASTKKELAHCKVTGTRFIICEPLLASTKKELAHCKVVVASDPYRRTESCVYQERTCTLQGRGHGQHVPCPTSCGYRERSCTLQGTCERIGSIGYEFTSSGILCTNHINCRDQLCVNLDTGELIRENREIISNRQKPVLNQPKRLARKRDTRGFPVPTTPTE